MKILHTLSGLLVFALSTSPALPQGEPTPEPSGTPPFWGCRPPNAWHVETHGYYGPGPDILEKLGQLPAHLKGRRVFLELTQLTSNKPAVVKFYEGQKDGTYSVWTWETTKASEVIGRINSKIMRNKGEACVGEECRKEFAKELKEQKPKTGVSIPDSPLEAFKSSLSNDAASYMCEIVWLLC